MNSGGLFISNITHEHKHSRINKLINVNMKIMKNKERATLNIQIQKKMELEKAAIELSYKLGRSISWTDIAHHMLNNYIKLAKEDITEKEG